MSDTGPSPYRGEDMSRRHEVLREVLLNRHREHVETLDKIDAEISEIQTQLSRRVDDARNRRQTIEEALSHLDAFLQFEGWTEPGDKNARHPQVTAGNGKVPIEAAYELLSVLEKPIHYRELAQRLSESGVYLAGKDPAASLLSKMSRDDRFRRGPERGIYGLASWRMRKSPGRKRVSKRSKTRRT